MLAKAVGHDGAKHINGRKLHLLVDTLGLVMVAVATAASVSERDGAHVMFATIGVVFLVCCGFGWMGAMPERNLSGGCC